MSAKSMLRAGSSLLLWLLVGGLFFASGAVAAPSPTPILGFQSEGSATSLIAGDSALGSVGVDGLNLTGAPGAVSSPTAADRRQLRAAHATGLPAVLLVGNYSARVDDFSEPLAWRTLGSARASKALADRLAGDVRSEGWDGISVDLEALHGRDRAGLVGLLADLRAALGSKASLTVCIENITAADEYAGRGYDPAGIARSVDQIVLMAYDQHGPWEAAPGPIGSQDWVRAGVRTLLGAVPAAQIDLGVAGYGYVWGDGRNRQVSDAAARALAKRAGVAPRWVGAVGEWTAALPDGATVWWSDARTLSLRERLARSLGLHGLAVWSLELADPLRP